MDSWKDDAYEMSNDELSVSAVATNKYSSITLQPTKTNGFIARDSEYKRLGTVSLLAGIDMLTGMICRWFNDIQRCHRSCLILQKEGYQLEAKVFNPKEDSEHLKWLHTIISNAKVNVEGTFHGLGKKYLQSYLNEFCYRFNRRFFLSELFIRIFISCISSHRIMFAESMT